jgi:hypothetical protein
MTTGVPPGAGFELTDGAWLRALAGGLNVGQISGFTANVSSSQSGGAQIPSGIALVEVDTSVTLGSVILPYAIAGTVLTIINNTLNQLYVYANPTFNRLTGTLDTINQSGSNSTPFTGVTASNSNVPVVTFYCAKNGLWLTGPFNISAGGGSGTVTSVGMTVPTGLTVSGSPILSSGTLAVSWLGQIPTGQMPAFSGDVTTSAGSTVSTISAGAVTLTKMANLAGLTVIGNASGSSAVPAALTQTQLTGLINNFTATLSGGVPASGGGTTSFLRADGNWAVPPGGGGSGTVTSVALSAPTGLSVSGSPITTSGTLTLSWSGTIPAAQIPTFSASVNGGVAASGGGTTNFLRADGTWAAPPGGGGGSGTVTSVAMTVPTGLAISGSPITTSGTLAVTWSGTIPAAQVPTFTSTVNGGVPASGGGSTNFMRADGTWAVPTVGGGGSAAFIYENASFGATAQTGYLVDTSGGAITVTLPASPSQGAQIQLMDALNTWAAHNVTLAGNGSNIVFSSGNTILFRTGSVVLLSYINSTIGWNIWSLA